MKREHRILLHKHICPYLKVFLVLILFLIGLVSLKNQLPFDLLTNDVLIKFFEGKLDYGEFVPLYFRPLSYNIILFSFTLFVSVLFSLILNKLVLTVRLAKGGKSGTTSDRKMLKKFFIPEIIVLYRLLTVVSILYIFTNSPLKDGHKITIICLSLIYVFLTVLIPVINWPFYYKWKKYILGLFSYGVPVVVFVFFHGIKYRYDRIDTEIAFTIFYLLLFIIEAAALILLMSGKIVQLDLNYAKVGKDVIKESIKSDKKSNVRLKLENYIKKRNKDNLNLSIYLFTLLIFHVFVISFVYFISEEPMESKLLVYLTQSLLAFTFFILFRFISRSTEIIKAFVHDITDKEKKSTDLTGKDRMLLAIKSLAETVILATIIRTSYSLYNHVCVYDNELHCKISEITGRVVEPFALIQLLIEELFLSVATMGFNVSFVVEGDFLLAVLHLVQLLVSISLITLSIATYISMSDNSNIK